MLKVGFIGWRGMVGSVLMSRMIESKDFDCILPNVFFDISGRAAANRFYATIWSVTRCL